MMKTTKPGIEGDGLTKRAALLALAKGLAFALAFPLPLILVRTLSQTDFGVYKQFSQVMLTALGLLSLHVGWTAFFFTGDLRLPKLIHLKVARKTPLFNGALECRLFEFPMVAGRPV